MNHRIAVALGALWVAYDLKVIYTNHKRHKRNVEINAKLVDLLFESEERVLYLIAKMAENDVEFTAFDEIALNY